jgi:hypothetical protein
MTVMCHQTQHRRSRWAFGPAGCEVGLPSGGTASGSKRLASLRQEPRLPPGALGSTGRDAHRQFGPGWLHLRMRRPTVGGMRSGVRRRGRGSAIGLSLRAGWSLDRLAAQVTGFRVGDRRNWLQMGGLDQDRVAAIATARGTGYVFGRNGFRGVRRGLRAALPGPRVRAPDASSLCATRKRRRNPQPSVTHCGTPSRRARDILGNRPIDTPRSTHTLLDTPKSRTRIKARGATTPGLHQVNCRTPRPCTDNLTGTQASPASQPYFVVYPF